MIEQISRKAFGITAILLAGSLMLTGLSSANRAFADKTTSPNEDVSATVSLLVNPSISLEIKVDTDDQDPNPDNGVTNAMFIEVSPGLAPSAGRFSALVTTNRDYILQLNGLGDNPTSMVNELDGTYFIPGTGCTVAQGTSCWGVISWAKKDAESDNPTYQAIPSPEDPVRFASGTGPVSEAETRFKVGISASPDIAAGTYKGKLVVTASNI